MKRYAYAAAWLVVLATVTACPEARPQPPAPGVTQLNAWLECVECKTELDAVVALGNVVVPDLAGILQDGPSAQRLDQERQYLEQRYRGMKDYERQHPDQRVALTQDQYVQSYLSRFVVLRRIRSARALGRIGTPAARAALNRTSQQGNLPPDLVREITRGLQVAPPGPTGPTGPTGAQGPTGPTGAVGPTGPRG